jgi:hypothetical protein
VVAGAGVLSLCAVTFPQPRLPHAELAVVSAAKLRDYVLNPAHPQGGPKARVFAAVLGLTRADWQYLRRQLLAGVAVSSRGTARVHAVGPVV